MKESLRDAIDSRRFHHQLLPMEVVHESGFDNKLVNGLRELGHIITEDKPLVGFTAVTAISRAKGYIEATFDPRRYGSTEII